jgi:hypothetical protein
MTTEKAQNMAAPMGAAPALGTVVCAHDTWTIYGRNQLGWGTCLDCGKEVQLRLLFNRLHERVETAIRDAQAVTKMSSNICVTGAELAKRPR